MIHLFKPQNAPPGQYYYPKGGSGRNWPPSPIIGTVAAKESNYRVANHIPRSSYADCYADIEAFTCNRVPSWCREMDLPAGPPAKATGGCKTCGAKIH